MANEIPEDMLQHARTEAAKSKPIFAHEHEKVIFENTPEARPVRDTMMGVRDKFLGREHEVTQGDLLEYYDSLSQTQTELAKLCLMTNPPLAQEYLVRSSKYEMCADAVNDPRSPYRTILLTEIQESYQTAGNVTGIACLAEQYPQAKQVLDVMAQTSGITIDAEFVDRNKKSVKTWGAALQLYGIQMPPIPDFLITYINSPTNATPGTQIG